MAFSFNKLDHYKTFYSESYEKSKNEAAKCLSVDLSTLSSQRIKSYQIAESVYLDRPKLNYSLNRQPLNQRRQLRHSQSMNRYPMELQSLHLELIRLSSR